ncbi:beta-ketoacyl synthase [Dokdonia sinensis]|uniref:Beta-ketoacyl synthase n=1 Tax=Dokdonia sinensis TaxID=2479847 RepID=A0A3M0G5N8_9FLAO|nr:beta-ketoacyl synthase N-terminal-like domain-containing protein [Dokdonia sinensis]RMB56419.1 beta-ketoacyl synthase [Dokdonia sinensis]
MLTTPIAITGLSSISPLGKTSDAVWKAYRNNASAIVWEDELEAFITPLSKAEKETIKNLAAENNHYARLDNSVLYGIISARNAIKEAGWMSGDFGINIGSSRGATQLFEGFYDAFLGSSSRHGKKNGNTQTLASPTTTLGNISSWVAHDLQSEGPEISHSITCSTALHAILNGAAWLQSGMATKFLVGGTEAALTPFTIAQMRAMKLSPTDHKKSDSDYVCRALDKGKKSNTMVLGEGAGMACLELGEKENARAYISGIGYATEVLEHSVSLSATGDCFQKSMKMALGNLDASAIDAIVMHAPGTIKGDAAELAAITEVFGENPPLLTTNKWKIGHTFGASGLLSLELAVLMLENQEFIGVPYLETKSSKQELNSILVNAVGFGGNAVSVLVTKA